MISHRKRKRNKYVRSVVAMVLLSIAVTMGLCTVWSTGFFDVEQALGFLPNSHSTTPPGKFRIVIDAGHGGNDPGATGVSGAYEKEFNLSLAHLVNELLEQDPMFETKMTRTDDQFVELEKRAALANEWHADALLSIHGNIYEEDRTVSGTETLYYHEDSIDLAQTLQKQVSKALGIRDRGVKQEQLVILSSAQVPAVIVESGFLTNPKEEALLLSSNGQDLVAHAIVDALKKYFSKKTPYHQTIISE